MLHLNGRRRVGYNDGTDLPFLGQRSRKLGQLLEDTLNIDTIILNFRCDVLFRRYAVLSAESRKR